MNIEDYKQRAYARLRNGDLNGALEDYNRVIAANPDDHDAIAARDGIVTRIPKPIPQTAPVGLTTLKPRVYIQVATPDQRTQFAGVADQLRTLGYDVPPIEVVGARAPSNTQVRLPAKDVTDGKTASTLIEQLRGFGVKADGPIPVQGGKTRPNHFELWVAAEPSKYDPKAKY